MKKVYYDYVYNCFICPEINFYQRQSKQKDVFEELKNRGYKTCKVIFKDKEEIKIIP